MLLVLRVIWSWLKDKWAWVISGVILVLFLLRSRKPDPVVPDHAVEDKAKEDADKKREEAKKTLDATIEQVEKARDQQLENLKNSQETRVEGIQDDLDAVNEFLKKTGKDVLGK